VREPVEGTLSSSFPKPFNHFARSSASAIFSSGLLLFSRQRQARRRAYDRKRPPPRFYQKTRVSNKKILNCRSMKPERYPIIRVYLAEIEKLHKNKAGLPLIFLIGATGELIIKEISKDSKTAMEKLIANAEKNREISYKQSLLFEDIRMYRNKYTHISADKILNEEISGLLIEDENGLLQNVNEIVLDDLTEKK
jgi:hypothetical protein